MKTLYNSLKMLSAVLAFTIACSQQANSQSRIQIIHNSPDSAASIVDVWVNGVKTMSGVRYHSASKFLNMPSGQSIMVMIKPMNSDSTTPSLFTKNFTLQANQSYYIVACGLLTQSARYPNPNGISNNFDLKSYSDAREQSQVMGNVDLRFIHGSPNADSLKGTIGGNFSVLWETTGFGGSGMWKSLLSAPVIDIDVYRRSTGFILSQIQVPLSSLTDSSVLLLASGIFDDQTGTFIDSTKKFGMLLVTPGGRVAPLDPTPQAVNASFEKAGLSLYPNPASGRNVTLSSSKQVEGYTLRISEQTGRVIYTGKALMGVNSNVQLPTQNLPRGLYILEAIDRKGHKSVTQIIQ